MEKRLGPDLDKEQRNSFYHGRYVVGDSVGNLRWLAASDNRARSNGKLDCKLAVDDGIDPCAWNPLIANGTSAQWSAADVSMFQRLIDHRTLGLMKALMDESGITALIALADSPEASLPLYATL